MKWTGHFKAAEVWRRESSRTWPIAMFNEIDATELEKIRARYKAKNLKAPSYTALVIKAIAQAIAEHKDQHPVVNGYVRQFLFFRSIHIFPEISCGFSKSVEHEGQELVLPGFIPSPEKLSLEAISDYLQSMSDPTQHPLFEGIRTFYKLPFFLQQFLNWLGAFVPSMRFSSRGSFNLTSVGFLGLDYHALPQSGALQFGIGLVRDRVVAQAGVPVVAKTFILFGSFDRRLMSGKPAALVMARVREILESDELGRDLLNDDRTYHRSSIRDTADHSRHFIESSEAHSNETAPAF